MGFAQLFLSLNLISWNNCNVIDRLQKFLVKRHACRLGKAHFVLFLLVYFVFLYIYLTGDIMINVGDLVTRKSHGNDIVFKVIQKIVLPMIVAYLIILQVKCLGSIQY